MIRDAGVGRRLGAAAIVLGAGALLAEVVAPVVNPATVAPLELAAWIRDARPGLDVIDVRPPAAYDAGHIPSARNVPSGGVEPAEGAATVVLYGEPEASVRKVAAAVSPDGTIDVFVLERGIDGWLDDVMAPRLADDATESERAAFAKQAELSRWFGGLPRVVPAESLEPPAAASSTGRSSRLLGGC